MHNSAITSASYRDAVSVVGQRVHNLGAGGVSHVCSIWQDTNIHGKRDYQAQVRERMAMGNVERALDMKHVLKLCKQEDKQT